MVKLNYKRTSGGDAVFKNFLLVHAKNMLNDATKGVCVRYNKYALACEHLGADSVLPVGHNTVDSGHQRLGLGEYIG